MSLCVEYQEPTRESGTAFATAAIALSLPATLVMSPPGFVSTTTSGTCSPEPNALSVRWFASYAEYPGIENDWNQRLESFAAENMPTTVSTIQAPTTSNRWRMTNRATWAIASRGYRYRTGRRM